MTDDKLTDAWLSGERFSGGVSHQQHVRIAWSWSAVTGARRLSSAPSKSRRRRDIYALLPPGDRHPLARLLVDALIETAADFGAAN